MAEFKEQHIFGPFGFLTPGDGTDRLSWHVIEKLPLLTVQ